jgi:adenylosuccinate synthase
VLLKRAVQVNGMTSIALTKLDVLGGVGDIKVCVAYDVDGTETTRLPSDAAKLSRVKPVYETMAGFEALNKATVAKASREGLGALPTEARRYVEAIEDALDVPVELVGLGPGREQTIDRRVLS